MTSTSFVRIAAGPAVRAAMTAAALAAILAGCNTSTPMHTSYAPSSVTIIAPEDPLATTLRLDDSLTGEQLPPPEFQRTVVAYNGPEAPGSIVIDTKAKFLYLVEGNGEATRYGVGVGREGFGWKGQVTIGSKQEWPRWFPPKEMIAREAVKGKILPEMVEGGPGNPLGARALYLIDDKGVDTLFRIHGTVEPRTIGTNVSSGCIRMANFDVMDLYTKVEPGAPVIVR